MDPDEKEQADAWAVAGKLILTIGPFVLLLALFALNRWIG